MRHWSNSFLEISFFSPSDVEGTFQRRQAAHLRVFVTSAITRRSRSGMQRRLLADVNEAL